MNLDGIDVSHHQGDIDWQQVVDSGVRLGIAKATEGRGFVDNQFAANRDGMRAAGLRWRGGYMFLDAGDPAVQADLFTRTVGDIEAGEFVVVDWERDPQGFIPAVTDVKIALDVLAARYGDRVMLYSAQWVAGFDRRPDYPLWLGGPYRPSVIDTGLSLGAVIAQWSSTASVPGVAGNVDADQILDEAALNRIAGLVSITPAEVPVPVARKGDVMCYAVDENTAIYALWETTHGTVKRHVVGEEWAVLAGRYESELVHTTAAKLAAIPDATDPAPPAAINNVVTFDLSKLATSVLIAELSRRAGA